MPILMLALRTVFLPVFGGLKTALGLFFGKVFIGTLLVAAGWWFRDTLFNLAGEFIDFVVTGLNGVGLDIPSVASMFEALPDGILIAMKRVGVDEALAIVGTAVAVRMVMGLFRWIKALNVVGG